MRVPRRTRSVRVMTPRDSLQLHQLPCICAYLHLFHLCTCNFGLCGGQERRAALALWVAMRPSEWLVAAPRNGCRMLGKSRRTAGSHETGKGDE